MSKKEIDNVQDFLTITVNQRRKMTPCQRPILTPLKSKKISFSVL